MARSVTQRRKSINTIVAWSVGLLIFFPILWIVILSFKTEGDAIKTPLEILNSAWTLESYMVVQERSDYFKHFFNSVVIAVGSTLLGILVAIPAAWVNGLCAIEANARYPDVDAIDENVTCGWRALSHIFVIHLAWYSG